MIHPRQILPLLLLCLWHPLCAQKPSTQTEKLATFCKVWGFLKYEHPAVARGTADWDQAFVSGIKTLSALDNREEINRFYLDWMNALGPVPPCKNCHPPSTETKAFNVDLNWLSDSSRFSGPVIEKLREVQSNRNQGKNRYVKMNPVGNANFEGEKVYKDSIFPSPAFRLLSLARFWNIIEYYYPYKYGIGANWDDVLRDMIPKFEQAQDTVAYHLAMVELTAKIRDSHSVFFTRYSNRYFGNSWAPFQFKIVEDKAVVTGFYNDSLSALDDVRFGDAFLSVEGKPILEILREKSPFIGASNEATLQHNAYYAIFNGMTDSVRVRFERNGQIIDKTIHRYGFLKFRYKGPQKQIEPAWKILPDNIGYVNMGSLKRKSVRAAMKALRHTRGIIFDVRNYPNGTMYKISKCIGPHKRPFARISKPDPGNPGCFIYGKTLTCGKRNRHPYKGKIILLCNEYTQSHAEFTLMALQSAPNVRIVGSQTAGADGNVSTIPFPGGYTVWMTGLGVFYPDGRETQRVGIVPDLIVKPSLEGIRQKKDEVLEAALKMARE